MAKPRTATHRTARSGRNKYTAATNRGGTSFSASGATKRQAYSRLKRGLGQNGG